MYLLNLPTAAIRSPESTWELQQSMIPSQWSTTRMLSSLSTATPRRAAFISPTLSCASSARCSQFVSAGLQIKQHQHHNHFTTLIDCHSPCRFLETFIVLTSVPILSQVSGAWWVLLMQVYEISMMKSSSSLPCAICIAICHGSEKSSVLSITLSLAEAWLDSAQLYKHENDPYQLIACHDIICNSVTFIFYGPWYNYYKLLSCQCW